MKLPITEQAHPRSKDLDLLEIEALVELLAAEQRSAVQAVVAVVRELTDVVELAVARLSAGGALHYVGAGSSGRLGVLDAAEMPPTFGTPPGLVCAHVAGGDAALRDAVEGAEDDREGGISEMRGHVKEGDVVIGLSASGSAAYVTGALGAARELGAYTVALVHADRSPLEREAERCIVLRTGAEIIAGSTRMKAGTAQKIALNTLSSAIMVRLGKVHGNVMVDVTATNRKLRARALRIVQLLAGVGEERAGELLAAADGRPKVAIVMQKRGVDSRAALDLIEKSGGSLRPLL